MSIDRTPLSWSGITSWAPDSGRLLVVDDDDEVRSSLERLLTRSGHTVETAASAEAAGARLDEEGFDVLLLDLRLPRMTGLEFLQLALEKDPELAVVMLTGMDSPDVALECLAAGARTYLVKPVDGEFLRVAIRDALATRRLLVERNRLAEGA